MADKARQEKESKAAQTPKPYTEPTLTRREKLVEVTEIGPADVATP